MKAIAMKMSPGKMKKTVDGADMSILEELIGNCESKMGSKFKKPETEIEIETPDEESDDMEDMDESKMEELLKMYKMLKG